MLKKILSLQFLVEAIFMPNLFGIKIAFVTKSILAQNVQIMRFCKTFVSVNKSKLRPIRLASEPFPYRKLFLSRATLETAHYVLVAGYQRVEDWSERDAVLQNRERKKIATINVAIFFGGKSRESRKVGLPKACRP